MKKKILVPIIVGLTALSMSITALAADWIQDSKGWRYGEDNGYFMNYAGGWKEIDGKWYCFDYSSNYMKHDTVIGGYTLGADGAWDGNAPVIPPDNNIGKASVPQYTYSFLLNGPNTEFDNVYRYTKKYKVNGAYIKNQWVRVYSEDGTWNAYSYIGENGVSLEEDKSQDGFVLGSSGFYTPRIYNGENGIRAWQDEARLCFHLNAEGTTSYKDKDNYGVSCIVVDPGVFSLRFDSAHSNITPSGHSVLIYGCEYVPEMNTWIAWGNGGQPIRYDFEYDKEYSLDFTQSYSNPQEFAQTLKEHNVFIKACVIDDTAEGDGDTGLQIYIDYANENSVKESDTPLSADDCCITNY